MDAKQIGEVIKEPRKRKGMTQEEELANMLGIGILTASFYKNGVFKVPPFIDHAKMSRLKEQEKLIKAVNAELEEWRLSGDVDYLHKAMAVIRAEIAKRRTRMKKKKAKLYEDMVLRIRELRASLRVRERWLKIVLRDRHTLSTPEQRRRAVAYLREKRYELEVFEKQIPAPPRTYKHYSTCRICKSTHVEAYISSNRYCPSCGEIIMPHMLYLPRYCEACGQRLWWPPEGIMIGSCYYWTGGNRDD